MTRQLNSLIHSTLFDELFSSPSYRGVKTTYPYNYYVDEKTGTSILEYALAGFKKSEIKVRVEKDLLIIKAKKETEVIDENSPTYIHKGIAGRSMEVSWKLNLPAVDIKSMTVKFTDGILTIKLPESEESKESTFDCEIN